MTHISENVPEKPGLAGDLTEPPKVEAVPLEPMVAPPPRSAGRGLTLLLSVVLAAIVAGVVAAAVVLGIEGYLGNLKRTPSQEAARGDDGEGGNRALRIQTGTVTVRKEGIEVYYPIPYASPPNLTLVEGNNRGTCVIMEQKPDHFKIKIADNEHFLNTLDIHWRATGVETHPR